ncbi:MAG: DNA-3-methyladenine glycosylase 2 family protein [Bacteroidota bacterium]
MPTFQEIKKHLAKDKTLKKIIAKTDISWDTKAQTDIYFELLKAITFQQLSTKAAQTIWNRFLELFSQSYPEAKLLLKMSDEKLRTAGISKQKAGYLKNIAAFSINKTLEYKSIKKLSDDELINYLSEIKGVGKWTAEMILMFSLKRTNVLPLDDLGIQQAIKKAYNLTYTNKKDMYAKMLQTAQNWQPYRSIACLYLWRFKDDKSTK